MSKKKLSAIELKLKKIATLAMAKFASKSELQTKADKNSVYQKEDTYTKAEVNNLVSPTINYATVGQYSDLPATGSMATIYRVSNWDGSSVVTTSYCEYAWNGSGYVLLSVKGQQGADMRLLTEETATIAPNVLNKWSVPVEELVLTLSAGSAGCENEYKLEFTVDGDDFTLSLGGAPVRWVQEPEWTDGSTYQVSILNNLATYAEWEAEVV